MKATELRIGNYIRYRDERNVIVQSLGYRFETGRPHDLQIVGSDDIREYNPIPLTEEWLLKFGFEKKDGYWHPKDCWHRYVFHNRVPFYTNCLNLEPEGCIVPHAKVYYIHQLQNLYFALTNKELKIKETVKFKGQAYVEETIRSFNKNKD